VALQTPLHVQRRNVPHQGHEIDATMTGRATYTFIDVNAVVEVDEVRKVMHAYPFDRLARAPAFAHYLQKGLLANNCEWQFMHVLVAGIPALAVVSTVV
jgi:hypothetical protein